MEQERIEREEQKELRNLLNAKLAETGIKLPKIGIPTFNGDIMEWKNFWEQFQLAVHQKTNLSDVEKLAYLQDALKDGPAKT